MISYSIKLSFLRSNFQTTIAVTIDNYQIPIVIANSCKFLETTYDNTIFIEQLDIFKNVSKQILLGERFKLFYLENEAFANCDMDELSDVFMKIHLELQKILDCFF